MILRELTLKNFRNLSGVYAYAPGLNIIIAANGTGKTNLLESVGYLSRGKSFRTVDELTTIDHATAEKDAFPFARVSGSFQDPLGNSLSREIVLEQIRGTSSLICKKTLKIDANKTTLNKFIDGFSSIIFSPNSIDLVTDSPITRRKDIDGFLSVYDEGYYSELSEYSKIVRGRNKILEKIQMRKGKISELSFWNASLVELGATIISKRKSLLQKTNPTMAKLASKLFNGDFNELSVHYVSKFTTEENTLDEVKRSFSSKIANNIKKEIFVGKSLYGPHREDFVFNLNGHTLRDFGSRGQQRLCSFLYKVAQHDMLQKKQDISPILLIDDLFSELDMQVRKRIQKFLESLSAQILLTGLNRTEFEKSFLKNAEVIEL